MVSDLLAGLPSKAANEVLHIVVYCKARSQPIGQEIRLTEQ